MELINYNILINERNTAFKCDANQKSKQIAANLTLTQVPFGKEITSYRQERNQFACMGIILAAWVLTGVLLWVYIVRIRKLKRENKDLLLFNLTLNDQVVSQNKAIHTAAEHERELIAIYKNLFATASHQFRTPMAIIDMIAHRFTLWPEEVTREILVERASRIRVAIKRISKILDNTINCDRLTESGITLQITEVNFTLMLQQACSYHGDIYPDRILNLSVPDQEVFICCDAVLVEEVLINLLSNAEKYSSPTMPINISLRKADDYIFCSISDYGIGIPADEISKIYDRFYRGSNATQIAGSGLGLSLSLALMRLHGGTLSCTSSAQGTTFELQLPIAGNHYG